MYPVVKICNPKIGMWEGFCSVLQPPPGMRREIRAPICALRKTSFADSGMAWQSIRGKGTGGGERTAENYVKMFWIVKPDGRTEKSHCTATGQDEVAWPGGELGKGRRQLYISSPPPLPFTLLSDALLWLVVLHGEQNKPCAHKLDRISEITWRGETKWLLIMQRHPAHHAHSADAFYTCLLTAAAFLVFPHILCNEWVAWRGGVMWTGRAEGTELG